MSQSPSRDGDEKTPRDITQTEKTEGAAEYPSSMQRILIMTALYLAIFLVTLVQLPLPIRQLVNLLNSSRTAGPEHHLDSHSAYHRRVSLLG